MLRRPLGGPLAPIGTLVLTAAVMALASTPALGTPDPGAGHGAFDWALTHKALREVERKQALRRDSLNTPEARRERANSRTAYRGLTLQRARAVAEASFGRAVTDPLWRAPWDAPGVELAGFRGPNVALLRRDTGAGLGLVDSLEPLTKGTGRDAVPVSVELTRSAQGFAPENALVASHIPDRMGDGLLTADGELAVNLAGHADSIGTRLGSRIFYASALRDTDWIVAPAPTGLGVLAQLRSPDAPTELELSLDTPGAEALRVSVDERGAARVDRHGTPLATISPPAAWDVQQTPVPTHYVADGNRLRIVVDHRGRDVAYPIVVDPLIDSQYTWRDNAGIGIGGWSFETPWSNYFWSSTGGGFGRGLYLVLGAPGYYYGDQTWSWWRYRAPGRAHIYRVDFGPTHHTVYQPTRPVCSTRGLHTGGDWDRSIPWWGVDGYGSGPYVKCSAFTEHTFTTCVHNDCSPAPERVANYAGIQQWVYGPGTRDGGNYDYLSGANVYLADGEDPTISGGPASTVTDPDAQWTFYHSDPGLGVSKVEISAPTYSAWNQAKTVSFPCYGTAWSPCPTTQQTGSPTYGNLPPGTHTIRVKVTDAGGRTSTKDWTVFVDYYTSIRYGGTNQIVDTDAEIEAVLNAMKGAADGGTVVKNGLRPTDQDRIQQWLVSGPLNEELDPQEYIPPPDAAGEAAVAAGGGCKRIMNKRVKLEQSGPGSSIRVRWRIRLRTEWCYGAGQVKQMYLAYVDCEMGSIESNFMHCGPMEKIRANCYGGTPERCAWTYRYTIRDDIPPYNDVHWCATNQVRGDGKHYRHGSCDLGPWSGTMYGG